MGVAGDGTKSQSIVEPDARLSLVDEGNTNQSAYDLAELERLERWERRAERHVRDGKYQDAVRTFQKSLDLRRRIFGVDHNSVIDVTIALGQACNEAALLHADNIQEVLEMLKTAGPKLEEAQSSARRKGDVGRSMKLVQCCSSTFGNIAACYQKLKQSEEASLFLKEATVYITHLPPADAAKAHLHLCKQLAAVGLHNEASAQAEEAIRRGEEDILQLQTLKVEALEKGSTILSDKVGMLCVAYNNLAVQRECLGQPCLEIYQKAVAVAEQYMDPGNPLLHRFRSSLVAAQQQRGNAGELGSTSGTSIENDKQLVQVQNNSSSSCSDDMAPQRMRRPLPPPLPGDLSHRSTPEPGESVREIGTSRCSTSTPRNDQGAAQASLKVGGSSSSKGPVTKISSSNDRQVSKSNCNLSTGHQSRQPSDKHEPRRPAGQPSKRRPRSGSENNRLPGQKLHPRRAASADIRGRDSRGTDDLRPWARQDHPWAKHVNAQRQLGQVCLEEEVQFCTMQRLFALDGSSLQISGLAPSQKMRKAPNSARGRLENVNDTLALINRVHTQNDSGCLTERPAIRSELERTSIRTECRRACSRERSVNEEICDDAPVVNDERRPRVGEGRLAEARRDAAVIKIQAMWRRNKARGKVQNLQSKKQEALLQNLLLLQNMHEEVLQKEKAAATNNLSSEPCSGVAAEPVKVTAASQSGVAEIGSVHGMVDKGPLTPAVTRRKPPSGSGLGCSSDRGLWAPSLGTGSSSSRTSGGYVSGALVNCAPQAPMEEFPESVKDLFGDGGAAAAAAFSHLAPVSTASVEDAAASCSSLRDDDDVAST